MRTQVNHLQLAVKYARPRSYDPPAGAAGKLIAKVFQREPSVQAREDLQRFKRLMETNRSD